MSTPPLHASAAPMYRNRRKRELFTEWIRCGLVQINFDATRDDVAVPDRGKNDPDYWIAVTEADLYTSHVEGLCTPPRGPPFSYSVPWDAIHSMYSKALNERMIWLEDVDRANKRTQVRKLSKNGRPIPC